MDKTIKIVVIIFTAAGIALLGYYIINQWHATALQQAIQKEKKEYLQKITQLEAEIEKMAAELEIQHRALPTPADLNNAFGETKPAQTPEVVDCQKITRQVVAFFEYLDRKAYLIWPDINMRAEELFDEIFKQLATTSPINVGEMEDLYSLMRNVTHFYRVLGKDRIELIKEILNSESTVIEPAMAVTYSWITACNSVNQTGSDQPNLKTLYQYACFFLNTLGGRSYLLRRDAKLRILTQYYALLIVDMANDAKINAYGIDIRPHLDYLFYDLNNQKGLLYRERYLTHLNALQGKYQ